MGSAWPAEEGGGEGDGDNAIGPVSPGEQGGACEGEKHSVVIRMPKR
jgi:hypothetical protein